jgi:hypothetical protein
MVPLHKNEAEMYINKAGLHQTDNRMPLTRGTASGGSNHRIRVREFDVFSAGYLKCIYRIRGDVEDTSDVASAGSHSLTL